MNISLIIPAYNEEKYIGPCLASVIKNAPGKFSEIIVVDNASTDATATIAAAYPGVTVVCEPKKGANCARQRGFEETHGDYVAYIDADTRMPPDWFTKAEKLLGEHPEWVALSGPYKYYDGSIMHNFIMAVLWWISAPIAARLAGYALLGGNFIAKREVVAAMGGFDSSVAFYGDDTAIARRLSGYGKVAFKMNFFMYTSIRRLMQEGIWITNFRYGMNFLWQVLFGKSFTKTYSDIRK